ncbi:histone deacetylase [Fulvivirga sp. RKSG066]|uniref:histone deacetylase family protein n=1 Tax=Fulvivirga aurantia TaxID=2529383 RepID=UPI0012BB9E9F|nr:histone deacetylase [Fulvivirga aurantia]MTI20731.1 histone deacetylase [Fulvivirga aurantia]
MVKFAFSDKYLYKLPEGHRFPIEKYELVKEQLLHEGTIEPSQLYDPGLATDDQILKVHTKDYWQSLRTLTLDKKAVRKIGLPVTEKSLNRARNSVAGTISAAHNALKSSVGVNLAGGTHHAYADHGEGFCVLNDIAISATDLINSRLVHKVLVVDLDVHQGNGTAKIFENNPDVFTFSMHGENNYPLHKEQSDLDIPLPYQCDDDTYLRLLQSHLPDLINSVQPDIIYFQAGVDVLASDKLGKLSLTRDGIKMRDQIVISSCKEQSIPLVITMGGGYSERLPDLVEAHCTTFRIAVSTYH